MFITDSLKMTEIGHIAKKKKKMGRELQRPWKPPQLNCTLVLRTLKKVPVQQIR